MSTGQERYEPDSKVKSIHYVISGIVSFYSMFGMDPFPTLLKMVPVAPVGKLPLDDNITSVDLLVPPLNESVFEGINPLADVRVRVYYQEDLQEKVPILIYFHAGGFCLGSVTHAPVDSMVRKFVKRGPFIAISVDYRLAPKFKLPAAIDDSVAAVLWASKGSHPILEKYGDSSKIIMLGDSSGGNLVAVVTQHLLQKFPEVKIAHQIMAFPSMGHPEPTESKTRLANGWLQSQKLSNLLIKSRLPNAPELINSYLIQPLLGSNIEKLPPAHIVLAKQDQLHDEGMMYYEKLKSAGVEVHLSTYKTVHGFLTMDFLPESQQALDDIFAILKEKQLAKGRDKEL